jgi:DNA invertase Pin-like site-specific DNA recombinase
VRAAVYARVSSEAQRERHTIASQLSTVPDYCRRLGWTVVGTYVDDGRTAKAGHLEEREAFTRLLADAAAGKLDVVAVVDFDRLTRSEDLTERGQVLGAFQRLGVKIAIANSSQLLDLATSGGDLFASLHAFFAAEENRKRRDRTLRGRKEAARAGRPATRPPLGLAYRDGAWFHTDDAQIVRDLFASILDGNSISKTCQSINARGIPSVRGKRWGRAAIHYILTNTAYRGEWKTDGASVAVPPIVSADDWYAAQARLSANRREKSGSTKRCYMLIGIAACACGARMRVQDSSRRGKTYLYYQCEERWRRDDGSPGCRTPAVRLEEAERRVWAKLVTWIERDDLRAALLSGDPDGDDAALWRRDLEEATERLERLDEAEAGVLTRVRRGLVTNHGADAELERIVAERRMTERQVAAARAALGGKANRSEAVERAVARVESLRRVLPSVTPEERREIARGLCLRRDGVVFGPDGSIEVTALLIGDGIRAEVKLSA